MNVRVSRTRKMRKFFSSQAIKKLVVLVSFTAIGVFGVIASAQGLKTFFKDPRYQIAEISVYNQHFLSQKEILEMSGISLGLYPYDFSVKKAAREIEKNPNVKRASVERNWPNKVVIKVVERSPAAVLHGKKNLMIDEEGVVIPMRPERPAGLVTLVGARVHEEEIGQTVRTDAVEKALALLREYHRTEMPLWLEFQQIDISNPRNLIVQTRGALKIYMGEGDYGRRLSRLTRVLEDLTRRGKSAEVVDLRFKDVVIQPLTAKADRTLEQNGPARLPAIRVER